MRRPAVICLSAGLAAVAAVALVPPRDPVATTVTPADPETQLQPAAPDPEAYAVLIADLERYREELAARYLATADPSTRRAVLRESQMLLDVVLPEMMRCWLGTPWDYDGMASQPGEGKIACGYFVSTVLRDAGFRLDRVRLAQQPSQLILGTFVPREAMTLRVGVPYDRFCREVRSLEPGIYIVGLDRHVGFLIRRDDDFRLIHASASQPECVVEQGPAEADVLRRSRYRVLGNLTARDELLRQWLAAAPWRIPEA